jgi:hypothetical protein
MSKAIKFGEIIAQAVRGLRGPDLPTFAGRHLVDEYYIASIAFERTRLTWLRTQRPDKTKSSLRKASDEDTVAHRKFCAAQAHYRDAFGPLIRLFQAAGIDATPIEHWIANPFADLRAPADAAVQALTDWLCTGPAVTDNSSPEFLPADHYKTKYGIPSNRLESARRRGRLTRSKKRNGRWMYDDTEVRHLYPEDFIDSAETR